MQQFMQAMLYKMQLSFFENIVLDFNKNMHSHFNWKAKSSTGSGLFTLKQIVFINASCVCTTNSSDPFFPASQTSKYPKIF